MVRCKPPVKPQAQGHDGQAILRLKPLAHAIALLLMAGSAHGATAFSSGWFAAKGASQAATAARTGGQVPGMPPPLSQRRAMGMTALLEPLMIVVMGAVVLVIVMAILLPIIEINQLVT
ncbi:hemagglutination repeat-containing protein [Pseudomonas sp. CF161]|nr:hemagglutination repeat-containing protein [Pseudomonas sp. CF161]